MPADEIDPDGEPGRTVGDREREDGLIRSLEALTVGPDEVLILRAPEDVQDGFMDGLLAALDQIGLRNRALVLSGPIELAKVTLHELNAVREGNPLSEIGHIELGPGYVDPGNTWEGQGTS